jgi:hypothetical protein
MIKDIGEVFQHPLLKGLSGRLHQAKAAQTDPTLDKIHAAQDFIRVEELNWDTKRCYIRSRVPDRSHPWVKNMVKSLLMEYYGSKAINLQVVVLDPPRS